MNENNNTYNDLLNFEKVLGPCPNGFLKSPKAKYLTRKQKKK
jgi:hypothetical protein